MWVLPSARLPEQCLTASEIEDSFLVIFHGNMMHSWIWDQTCLNAQSCV